MVLKFSAATSLFCVLLFLYNYRLNGRAFVVPYIIDSVLVFVFSYLVVRYFDYIIDTYHVGVFAATVVVTVACCYHIWVRTCLYVMNLRSARLMSIEKEVFLQYGINIKVYQCGVGKIRVLPNKRNIVVSKAVVDGLEVKDIANVMLVRSVKCRGYSMLLVVSVLIPILVLYFAFQFEQYKDMLLLLGIVLMSTLSDLLNYISSIFALRSMSDKISKEELLCSISRYYNLLNRNKSKMQQNFNNADKFGITRIINKV